MRRFDALVDNVAMEESEDRRQKSGVRSRRSEDRSQRSESRGELRMLFHVEPLSVWQVVERIQLRDNGRLPIQFSVSLCAQQSAPLWGRSLIFHWI